MSTMRNGCADCAQGLHADDGSGEVCPCCDQYVPAAPLPTMWPQEPEGNDQ